MGKSRGLIEMREGAIRSWVRVHLGVYHEITECSMVILGDDSRGLGFEEGWRGFETTSAERKGGCLAGAGFRGHGERWRFW